jgi:hypothetical protein
MGKPCVAGCKDVVISGKKATIAGKSFKQGDFVTIDGTTGEVFLGQLDLSQPKIAGELDTFLGWADEIRKKLAATVRCAWPPSSLRTLLPQIAEAAGVNLGWDSTTLASPTVAIPKGTHRLDSILELILRQTPLGRYRVEPGRGIWLYLEGRSVDFPLRRGTVWERAVVRAYDVMPLLRFQPPQEIVHELQRRVDPGRWDRGFPAASVFPPTGRLIVVHDEESQPRVAAAVRAMRSSPAAGARPR